MYRKFLFFILILSIQHSYAQNDASDTLFFRRILDSTIAFYNKSLGENTLLYNGREYTGNYSRSIGHPFYASDQPQKGSIFYDRILYPHSAIFYDLINDEIFIKNGQNISVKLINEKVDHFSLGDHVFVRITRQSNDNKGLTIGFYEIVSNGLITVLAKRKKQLEPSFNLEDPYQFVQYDRYFIKTDDSYHEVENEPSLLSLFPGHKKEIRKHLRNKGLSFKKDREFAIVQVVEYFAQFKK